MFLPKVEKRDFSIYQAARLNVESRNSVEINIKKACCSILGKNYDEMESCNISYGHRNGRVLAVARGGATYSEAHMGFGEGRAAYLVTTLETLPDKSLVLIEEPETSLHPSAQHAFGHFLMDVSIRKGHQIMLTTHSEYLLRALPSASRNYLFQDGFEIKQVQGLSASEATSLMTEGHDKALNILVEDPVQRRLWRK